MQNGKFEETETLLSRPNILGVVLGVEDGRLNHTGPWESLPVPMLLGIRNASQAIIALLNSDGFCHCPRKHLPADQAEDRCGRCHQRVRCPICRGCRGCRGCAGPKLHQPPVDRPLPDEKQGALFGAHQSH